MASRSVCLIDTNVLVYAWETVHVEKSRVARDAMRECVDARSAALSTQVLLETFDVLARKTREVAQRNPAAEYVGRLAVAFPVLPASAQTVLLAADCARRHDLRVYDAMLWAAAFMVGIRYVLTEDIGHRRVIEGVEFVNPFAPDFEIREFLEAAGA